MHGVRLSFGLDQQHTSGLVAGKTLGEILGFGGMPLVGGLDKRKGWRGHPHKHLPILLRTSPLINIDNTHTRVICRPMRAHIYPPCFCAHVAVLRLHRNVLLASNNVHLAGRHWQVAECAAWSCRGQWKRGIRGRRLAGRQHCDRTVWSHTPCCTRGLGRAGIRVMLTNRAAPLPREGRRQRSTCRQHTRVRLRLHGLHGMHVLQLGPLPNGHQRMPQARRGHGRCSLCCRCCRLCRCHVYLRPLADAAHTDSGLIGR